MSVDSSPHHLVKLDLDIQFDLVRQHPHQTWNWISISRCPICAVLKIGHVDPVVLFVRALKQDI